MLGGVLVTEEAQLVPVGAADLVQRLVGELDHVIRVDADGRLRSVLADRLGAGAGHVIETARLEAPAKIAGSSSLPLAPTGIPWLAGLSGGSRTGP